MRRYSYYLIILLALLASCGDTESEFSRNRCYLVIDNSKHLDQTLATAMNSMSKGVFCCICEQLRSGAETYYFKNNQGLSSYKTLNAEDIKRTRVIGVYNESGIIVGYGTLNDAFYAYDRQCPNCYKEDNMPRHALSMDTSGRATCSRCGREYDMNNGGIVIKGESGDKLMRYRASTTGPQGVLSVSN